MHIYNIPRRFIFVFKTFIPSRKSFTAIIPIIIISITTLAASAIVLANAEKIQGQDTITIIPGSSDKNNPVFFDVTYCPIQIGKEVSWYNADDVNHKIIISSGNETTPAGIENKK